jgi:hypothetical protein
VENVKTCVQKPAHAIGMACGKTPAPAECPTVLGALDAWGKAPKSEVGTAMKAVMNLQVTDRTLKSQLGEIARCVTPIAAALDEVDKDKKQIQQLASFDQKPEHDLDARFKVACGRGLFNK